MTDRTIAYIPTAQSRKHNEEVKSSSKANRVLILYILCVHLESVPKYNQSSSDRLRVKLLINLP